MLVFLPEHLLDERLTDLTNNIRHPWGCVLKPRTSQLDRAVEHGESTRVVLVCALVKSCDTRSISNVADLISETCGTSFIDTAKLPATVQCLLPSCPNHGCGSREDDHIFLSTLYSSLWIAFRWDVLSRLRRKLLADLLDRAIIQAANHNRTEQLVFDWSQLSQWEEEMLIDRLGPYLAVLIVRLTEFPVDTRRLSRLEQSVEQSNPKKLFCFASLWTVVSRVTGRLIQASYTLSLIRFHMQRNGRTHRLRGFLPGSLIPGSELLDVSRSILTDAISLACTSPHRQRVHFVHDQAQPPATRHHATDPAISLLGALQLLFLLLSLLTPLHTATQHQLLSKQSRLNPLSSCRPDVISHSSWMISETDCAHVPTLGWFFVNASDSDGLARTDDAPHIVSPQFLVHNWFVSQAECWFATWNRWIEFFTCELTRLLIWLESGEPAGLKINLHLARLLGHFFLYHILAWRSYCSLLIHVCGLAIGLLQQFTEVHTFDEAFCANVATSACLMLSTVYVARAAAEAAQVSPACWLPPVGAVFISYASSVIRLTGALFVCLLLDLINLIAVHLTTFYVYTIHLLVLQCRAIGAAWRLCRNGSKWNPLRSRVDTVPDMYVGAKIFTTTTSACNSRIRTNAPQCNQKSASQIQAQVTVADSGEQDVHLDRLFVATLLGLAVGLCLLPTTLAFYITFSSIRLLIVLVQQSLRACALFILDVPLSAVLAWIMHSDLSKTELALVAPPLLPVAFPLTRMKLIRPSLTQTYEEHRLLQDRNLFGPSLSFGKLIHHLLTATEM